MLAQPGKAAAKISNDAVMSGLGIALFLLVDLGDSAKRFTLPGVFLTHCDLMRGPLFGYLQGQRVSLGLGFRSRGSRVCQSSVGYV